MLPLFLNFVDVLLAALMAGAAFGAWLFLNPSGLDASRYVVVYQQGIRGMNKVMPRLGGAIILLTILAAVLARGQGARMLVLVAAAACFIVSGVITRLINQPMNAVLMTWNSDRPPANWTGFRDRWWRWHMIRLASVVSGLALLLGANLPCGPVR